MSYNYRHYNPVSGGFSSRDVLNKDSYAISDNNPIYKFDYLGLLGITISVTQYKKQRYRLQTQKVVCGWAYNRLTKQASETARLRPLPAV